MVTQGRDEKDLCVGRPILLFADTHLITRLGREALPFGESGQEGKVRVMLATS